MPICCHKRSVLDGFSDGFIDGCKETDGVIEPVGSIKTVGLIEIDGFMETNCCEEGVGFKLGCILGKLVGLKLGPILGSILGDLDGLKLGTILGSKVGKLDGSLLKLGSMLGNLNGYELGFLLGNLEGLSLGCMLGKIDGLKLGFVLGKGDGFILGYMLGTDDGCLDGLSLGEDDGFSMALIATIVMFCPEFSLIADSNVAVLFTSVSVIFSVVGSPTSFSVVSLVTITIVSRSADWR